MASSRSSPPVEGDVPRAAPEAAGAAVGDDPLSAAIRRSLAYFRAQGKPASQRGRLRAAVALSGGRDSMALLDALAALARELELAPSAIHVHHGLSPNADAWADFCAAQCARREIELSVQRVEVARAPQQSLEATARTARYAALARADADAVLLAHHADDQAETLLLQLLRGAGPHGLAAMPRLRIGEGPALLRPLLALSRNAIEDYVRIHGVAWIDDESNADTGLARNFIRHDIAPRLAARFPGYPATLARAAAHAAEAARLLDQLAALDALGAGIELEAARPTLDRVAFASLARLDPARARNLLRWFLRRHALRPPSAARLAAMQDQIAHAATDARVRLVHAGAELGIHRGRLVVHAPPAARYAIPWQGQRSLALPHGRLEFDPVFDTGLAAQAIDGAPVVVRPRGGGERIRLAPDRPRQMLKHVLQEAGMPSWARRDWPLVWCGNALAAVPGIGVAAEFQTRRGARGYALHWRAGAS